jgi:hypothetical protein
VPFYGCFEAFLVVQACAGRNYLRGNGPECFCIRLRGERSSKDAQNHPGCRLISHRNGTWEGRPSGRPLSGGGFSGAGAGRSGHFLKSSVFSVNSSEAGGKKDRRAFFFVSFRAFRG